MKKKAGAGAQLGPQSGPRRAGAGFWLLMAASTLVTGCLGFFWYVSPLALGFSDWPDDPGLLLRLYVLSWHWGIPALLVAQALALFLAWRGRRVGAGLVAVLANLGFAALISTIIALIG
ncbi:hypothetical protein [Paracoccus sp. (in: a-proteobacteria)]|uniref:hypothetical protein n=1 Tax=Paracoccus sp. TaxID=267 RepID=UPI0035B2FEE8